jgi:exodeoxyribonuclease-3
MPSTRRVSSSGATTVKIATWNVNGIRARLDRVVAWLGSRQPDVLCLQEIKIEDDKFPKVEFEALGYRVETHGQKSYNGVALLARHDLHHVQRDFADGGDADGQARLIVAMAAGVRVVSAYFPNGQQVGSDKYEFKLRWMERLRAMLDARGAASQDWALCGDFNVAPEDIDTHDPQLWNGKILCSSQEREALAAIRALGFVDALRVVRPSDQVFTWWDYRMLAFPKNLGLRIDHVYVTPSLSDRVQAAEVDRNERKGKQTSDHAPLVITLRD